jgi:hypothetical protein
MTKNQINTRNQNIEEMFVTEMDNLYYPGYAAEIAETEPEKYEWELAEFKGVVKSIVPVV